MRSGAVPAEANALCSIDDLSVHFALGRGQILKAIDHFSLEIMPAQAVGIVGESGSGKSLLSLSMLGLLPVAARHTGRVSVTGIDVLSAPAGLKRSIRGRVVGLILQDPTSSLNPLRTIGSQLRESARLADGLGRQASGEIGAALQAVNLDPDEIVRKHPFELSGGMNQRVAIAMALLQRPQLLIADEPTTALDATVQVEILTLLRAIQRSRGMAFVLISHDLAVVYQAVDVIAVMYAGRLVEYGPAELVIRSPRHPYTQALVASIPHAGTSGGRLAGIPGQLTPRYVGDDGCPFRERCPVALPVCATAFPGRDPSDGEHTVWCWQEILDGVGAS
jgi:oligopeptide/dipeptide ABC transporter ATP-binding protein